MRARGIFRNFLRFSAPRTGNHHSKKRVTFSNNSRKFLADCVWYLDKFDE